MRRCSPRVASRRVGVLLCSDEYTERTYQAGRTVWFRTSCGDHRRVRKKTWHVVNLKPLFGAGSRIMALACFAADGHRPTAHAHVNGSGLERCREWCVQPLPPGGLTERTRALCHFCGCEQRCASMRSYRGLSPPVAVGDFHRAAAAIANASADGHYPPLGALATLMDVRAPCCLKLCCLAPRAIRFPT